MLHNKSIRGHMISIEYHMIIEASSGVNIMLSVPLEADDIPIPDVIKLQAHEEGGANTNDSS